MYNIFLCVFLIVFVILFYHQWFMHGKLNDQSDQGILDMA